MSKEKKYQKENEKKGKVGERNRKVKENENRKIGEKKLGIDEWKLLG